MRLLVPSFAAASTCAFLALVACSEEKPEPESPNGNTGGGGSASAVTGGSANTGGITTTAGVSSGGAAPITGGAGPTGGRITTTGGASSQGGSVASGGKAVGGGGAPSSTGGATTATGGSGGEDLPPTFTIVKAILASNQGMCSAAPCHPSSARLNLVDNAELLKRMTSFMSQACGMPFVTPGDPEMSAFVKILKGPCGDIPQMPYQCIPGMFGTCLPDEYVAAIEQWIENGAKDD
jgi:hypothetical protein